jgi:hypothetical protein
LHDPFLSFGSINAWRIEMNERLANVLDLPPLDPQSVCTYDESLDTLAALLRGSLTCLIAAVRRQISTSQH